MTAHYPNLAALQDAHMALADQAKATESVLDQADAVRAFVERAVATGAVLDAREDRQAAQSLVNYWVSRAVGEARAAGRSDATGFGPEIDTLLAEFTPASLGGVAAAADRVYSGLQPDGQVLARRLFLRLVRMRAEGAGDTILTSSSVPGSENTRVAWKSDFEPIPAARGALHDRGDPAKVDAIVKAFADAGVVRVVPGDTPTADQIMLRSAVLMTDWEQLKAWINERRNVRRRAADWQEANARPTAYHRGREWVLWILYGVANWVEKFRLLVFERLPGLDLLPDRGGELLNATELEDARGYHDRSETERAFIDASRFDAERSLARNKLLTGLFGITAAVACVGWALTGWYFVSAKSEAASARGAAKLASERLRLSSLRVFIRGWADVAAARSDADLKIAQGRWDSLVNQQPLRESLEPTIKLSALTNRVAQLKVTEEDPECLEVMKVDTSSFISDVHQIRNELLVPEPTREALLAVRSTAFDMVRLSANGVHDGINNSKATQEIGPFVKEFWKQYWGEMLLVEGKEVESAMVRFGDVLNEAWPEYKKNLKDAQSLAPGKPKPAFLGTKALEKLESAYQDLLSALDAESKDKDFSQLRSLATGDRQ